MKRNGYLWYNHRIIMPLKWHLWSYIITEDAWNVKGKKTQEKYNIKLCMLLIIIWIFFNVHVILMVFKKAVTFPLRSWSYGSNLHIILHREQSSPRPQQFPESGHGGCYSASLPVTTDQTGALFRQVKYPWTQAGTLVKWSQTWPLHHRRLQCSTCCKDKVKPCICNFHQ